MKGPNLVTKSQGLTRDIISVVVRLAQETIRATVGVVWMPLSLFIVLATSLAATASAQQIAFLYSDGVMTQLGTLGGSSSMSFGINDSGQVVGWSFTATGEAHAFLYSGGVMTDLGTFGGGYSYAHDINNSGQAVGFSITTTGQHHAFIYSNGAMMDIGTLPGMPYSSARDINDNGQVVGRSRSTTDYPSDDHIFLYTDGVMADLGIPLGGQWAYANSINSNGQIVGQSVVGGAGRGFLYSDGAAIDIGTLGGSNANPGTINDSGQVVGWSTTASGEEHAFLYSGGVMTDLGVTLLGGARSMAQAINNNGEIVGSFWTASGEEHAFLYSGGVVIDLGPGRAFDINNHGQVVGHTNENPVSCEGILPELSVLISNKSGPQNARVWTVTLTNKGYCPAENAQIDGLTLTQTYGAACTPVITSPAAFPLSLGNIPASSTASGAVVIDFSGCANTARFRATIPYSANDGAVSGSKTLNNQFR